MLFVSRDGQVAGCILFRFLPCVAPWTDILSFGQTIGPKGYFEFPPGDKSSGHFQYVLHL